MTEDKNKLIHISSSWSTVIPDDVIFKCLEQYRVHSIWKQPVICGVCASGLLRVDIDSVDVSDGRTAAIDFSTVPFRSISPRCDA